MASLGDLTITIELPEHFHLLPEAVQMALVERMSWEMKQTTVVTIQQASLAGSMRCDKYRHLRSN